MNANVDMELLGVLTTGNLAYNKNCDMSVLCLQLVSANPKCLQKTFLKQFFFYYFELNFLGLLDGQNTQFEHKTFDSWSL